MAFGFRYLGEDALLPGSFDCGEPELNEFLLDDARRFVKQGLSAVRLLVDMDNEQVAGFYAISPLSVEAGRLSDAQRAAYNVAFPIPAWLVGRLAVDKRYQQRHLGAALLLDAMNNIRKRSAHGAGALFIVDAKNKKIKAFYKKYGFTSLHSCALRMFRPIDHPES